MSEKVSWTEIFAQYARGASYEELAKTFKLTVGAISMQAKRDNWEKLATELALPPEVKQATMQIREDKIAAARDSALRIVESLRTRILTAAEHYDDTIYLRTPADTHRKLRALKELVQSADILQDMHSRAVGDVLGAKGDIQNKSTFQAIQILMPSIMTQPRFGTDGEAQVVASEQIGPHQEASPSHEVFDAEFLKVPPAETESAH